MKHKIKVTETDIKNGEPSDCQRCAIALAVKREFPSKEVEVRTVENDDMRLGKDGDVYIALDDKLYLFEDENLNHKIYTFIDRFDMDYGVDPFEFELEVR